MRILCLILLMWAALARAQTSEADVNATWKSVPYAARIWPQPPYDIPKMRFVLSDSKAARESNRLRPYQFEFGFYRVARELENILRKANVRPFTPQDRTCIWLDIQYYYMSALRLRLEGVVSGQVLDRKRTNYKQAASRECPDYMAPLRTQIRESYEAAKEANNPSAFASLCDTPGLGLCVPVAMPPYESLPSYVSASLTGMTLGLSIADTAALWPATLDWPLLAAP